MCGPMCGRVQLLRLTRGPPGWRLRRVVWRMYAAAPRAQRPAGERGAAPDGRGEASHLRSSMRGTSADYPTRPIVAGRAARSASFATPSRRSASATIA